MQIVLCRCQLASLVLSSVNQNFGFLSRIFLVSSKGRSISKCLFGVFTFFQKTNKNKSTSSKVEFVCSFFGRKVDLKKSFRICQTFTILLVSDYKTVTPQASSRQERQTVCLSVPGKARSNKQTTLFQPEMADYAHYIPMSQPTFKLSRWACYEDVPTNIASFL